MNTASVSRVGESITDTAQDVANQVVERAPDIASAVGRGARSTADRIVDTVTTVAQKTPFVEAPRKRSAAPIVRIAFVVAIVGVVAWFLVNRRRNADVGTSSYETPAVPETPEVQRRHSA